MRSSVARHLAAFRGAVCKLETYYRDLPTPPTTPPRDQLFPYPSTFKSLLDDTSQEINYLGKIGDTLVFLAQLLPNDAHRICVKFVRRYSDEAHRCCAQLGFAPNLLGFQRLPGGWYMVVMDWLGSDKWSRLDELKISHEDVNCLVAKVTQLHQSGYGHGDLRATNILVSKSNPKHYMVIDFDWAGQLGKICYPMNVNKIDIWRPDGVADGALVLAEHDLSMLEHLSFSS
jgi:hypothetical protein